jgi:hypothetical protein
MVVWLNFYHYFYSKKRWSFQLFYVLNFQIGVKMYLKNGIFFFENEQKMILLAFRRICSNKELVI